MKFADISSMVKFSVLQYLFCTEAFALCEELRSELCNRHLFDSN